MELQIASKTVRVSFRQAALACIAISFVIKVIPSFSVGLGNDEVYYWTYARKLQWNYFDHPPMIALVVRLMLFIGHSEGVLRLGSLSCSALASWLIYLTTAKISNERAGVLAVILFSSSFYCGVISGFLIMPDSIQILCWTAALYCFVQLDLQDSYPANMHHWIIAGICSGLAVLSKVHGLFLPLGMLIYAAIYKRRYLRVTGFYVYFLIVALFATPIILWNAGNDFVNYNFHEGRITSSTFQFRPASLAREVVGELLYNNPINVLVALTALAAVKTGDRLLRCVALPMLMTILLLSAVRDTLPHWSGPAHLTLIPIAAIYLEGRGETGLRILRASAALFATGFATAFLAVCFFPGTLGSKATADYGRGDVTLDLYGWKQAGVKFSDFIRKQKQNNSLATPHVLVASQWFPAAHEDYYFCQPNGLSMVGLGQLSDLHHYYWLNALLVPEPSMSTVYCVVPSNLALDPIAEYASYYRKAQFVQKFAVLRSGSISRYFSIYKLSGWHGSVPKWQ